MRYDVEFIIWPIAGSPGWFGVNFFFPDSRVCSGGWVWPADRVMACVRGWRYWGWCPVVKVLL